MAVKLTSQQKERALQVASAISASVAVNGTIAEEKTLIQACYTAVRLITAMELVVDACEADETLLDANMRDGEAYLKCRDVITSRKATRQAEADSESAKVAEESTTKGKTGKGKPEEPKTDG